MVRVQPDFFVAKNVGMMSQSAGNDRADYGRPRYDTDDEIDRERKTQEQKYKLADAAVCVFPSCPWVGSCGFGGIGLIAPRRT
jgi:hypothetical protein